MQLLTSYVGLNKVVHLTHLQKADEIYNYQMTPLVKHEEKDDSLKTANSHDKIVPWRF